MYNFGNRNRTCELQEIFTLLPNPILIHLFRANLLQLSWAVDELGCVCLRNDPPLVWLLDKVLVALLLSKPDGVLFGRKVQLRALHKVC